MKKIFLSSIFTLVAFITILFGFSTNTYASCPTGYLSATVTVTAANGCRWDITFCYTCPIVGFGAGDIIVDDVKSKDPDCTDFDEGELADLTIQYYGNNLCTIPFCEIGCEHYRVISIKFPVCFQYHIVGYYAPPNPNLQLNSYIQSCHGGYCLITYKACRQQNVPPYAIWPCPGHSDLTYTLHDLTCDTEPFVFKPDPAHKENWPQQVGDNPFGGCFQYVQDCHYP
jgi:hypothetical protein